MQIIKKCKISLWLHKKPSHVLQTSMNVQLTHTPATETTGSAPTRMDVSNAPARNLDLKAMDSFVKVR